ncbi:hypothetical protein [Borreliella americana]|uniref:hypothetical protein n=1 Tax=Borreliella americana TaxID=478807 RepID=UPI001E4C6A07|nr:hypothetical protein [Borreliella americana]MCD2332647.1 hypothetical protein [Borreliella americana]
MRSFIDNANNTWESDKDILENAKDKLVNSIHKKIVNAKIHTGCSAVLLTNVTYKI